jgi:hypothetical protein
MSVPSKMFCTNATFSLCGFLLCTSGKQCQSFLLVLNHEQHAWAVGRQSSRGNIPYLPWRLVTSCESHSTVLPVHVLFGAEMAIELQWHGGDTAVRWEAPRRMETGGILSGQLGPRWPCANPSTRGAAKVSIKSLKPHNLAACSLEIISQISKSISSVFLTKN